MTLHSSRASRRPEVGGYRFAAELCPLYNCSVMMKLLRKHRHWLMIVIAILAIPFIFYFVQRPDYGAMRSDRFARIYDRNVSMLEAQQIVRLYTLAQALGMSDFLQNLAPGVQDPNQVYVQFILNLLVLRHEAERLGIRPSSSEVAEVVRALPVFQGESGFDLHKFSDFVQNALAPNGLAEEHIERLVRDQLSLNQIKELLGTGVSIPQAQVNADYQRAYDKLYVSLIRLRPEDFAREITISDEDVQKYYETHKAELKSEEKRKVDFVSLTLTEDQKKLAGKERIDALQELSDRANDFTQALLEKDADFKQVAERFHAPVRTTGEFTATEADPQLKVDPQLVAAGFKLSKQEPNSDPVQVADGFYILHLAGIVDAHPLAIEEAKPKIVEMLKKTRGRERMSTKGAEIAQQLREATKSPAGGGLEAAAQQAGVKLEKVPPFSVLEETKEAQDLRATTDAQDNKPKEESPEMITIKNAVVYLEPGEVTDFLPAEDSGLIAVLEKREPPPDAMNSEKKAAFEKRLLDNKRRLVFYGWLHERQEAAGVQFAKG
jgi:peptidyl-prolyl cis-trans isomerase D